MEGEGGGVGEREEGRFASIPDTSGVLVDPTPPSVSCVAVDVVAVDYGDDCVVDDDGLVGREGGGEGQVSERKRDLPPFPIPAGSWWTPHRLQ